MNNTSPHHSTSNIDTILTQLNQQDVEEFYVGYQYWNLQHHIEILQNHLNDIQQQIIENAERMQEVQPTAIELATLARLQSNGVSDVVLLDRMLERGEAWLDRTMQRLDYLEQLDDFISDDYTQWCRHAIEGAYDWIDSVLDGNATSEPSTIAPSASVEDVKEEELKEVTEEIFLQKISTDGDEAFIQEITMKRPSITTTDLQEVELMSEDIEVGVEAAETPENVILLVEEANSIDTLEDTKTPSNEEDALKKSPSSEEAVPIESNSTSHNDQPTLRESVEISSIAQKFSDSQTNPIHEHVASKRPNYIKRFFGKVWGS